MKSPFPLGAKNIDLIFYAVTDAFPTFRHDSSVKLGKQEVQHGKV